MTMPRDPITADDLRMFIRRLRLTATITRLADALAAGNPTLTEPELDALADLCDDAALHAQAALVRSWIPEVARERWLTLGTRVRVM